MNEVELKFLNIDVPKIVSKIEQLGAVKKYDTDISSHNFVKEGFHGSDSSQKCLRLRQIEDVITLTYKGPSDENSDLEVRNEIEVTTTDFDNTVSILQNLGFDVEPLFTKHRVHYELGNICFELDTLKNLPTYLEIETQNEADMIAICDKLGIDIATGQKGSIFEVLARLNN